MNTKENLLQILKQSKERFSPYNLLYDQLVNLPFNTPIYIFALGKAAYQMTEAVLYHASNEDFIRIKGGLVITRYGNVKAPLKDMTIIEASHINPDENSLKAGQTAIEFLKQLNENDILLVLLSGGGTALMEKPVEGIGLDEFNRRVQEMIKSGTSFEQIDAERKNLSEVKGGKLLQYIKSKHIFIYAMSDVPDDKPKYIASNPFLPDAERAEDQMNADNFHRFDNLTTDKFIPQNKAILYKIIANNRAFCEIIKDKAFELTNDLKPDTIHIMNTDISREAAIVGQELAELAKKINLERGRGFPALQVPCLLIFGGTPVINKKGSGRGGRCMELALAAVEGISELPQCSLLTYATDGLDGIPESAGAIVDNNTKQELFAKGIDINASLENNDSFTALSAVNATIPGEYTGVNVNDIALLYIQ